MSQPRHQAEDASEPLEETHLLEYWFAILRRRRLVLAVVLAVFGLAALRALLTQPVYEGVAQLIIERDDPKILEFKEVTQVDAAREDYYQTQYKLLQSRALARSVIQDLKLLEQREFGGPRTPEQIAAILQERDTSTPEMEETIDGFLKRLKVQPVKNSRLVKVAFEARDPGLAARSANRLSQVYIERTLGLRHDTSSDAVSWLGTQIAEQREKVATQQLALQKLKEQEGIVNIEERRALLDQRLKDLGSRLNELKTERLEKGALWQQMSRAANPEELPEVLRDPLIQSLRVELANLERQAAKLLELYLDQHPEVIKVRNQIDETRKKMAIEARRLVRAAQNAHDTADAQARGVAADLELAKQEKLDLDRRGLRYDTLKRELDAGETVLTTLLSRHSQTSVAQDLKSSNIRIVDLAAVPRQPIRPKRMRDMVLGLLLGAGVGVGLAFFLDYMDNKIKSPEDVRRHLSAPLLTVVYDIAKTAAAKSKPRGKADLKPATPSGPLLLTAQPNDPTWEAYRVLRTALNYSWPEAGPRIVAVTSTIAGEGKTTTSINLALTLAATEGRVLLIDADMRKPQTHHHLRQKRSPGLSDVLVGKMPPSQAIQTLADRSLSYMPAGSHVPSPSDLLTARVLKGLLDGLRGFYRWIVIDTPPVAPVADTLVIAPLTDGVITVVGTEMAPQKAVDHTIVRITQTGARVLGVVLNRAETGIQSYYGRYGRYYGHYGYGYGQGYGGENRVN